MGAHSGSTVRWDTYGKLLSRCVTKKSYPTNAVCEQSVEGSPEIVHVLVMLCRNKCDEDGTTLQESITLAKVQQIDMVDEHNGSHGCNGRCLVFRKSNSDSQSCAVAPSM